MSYEILIALVWLHFIADFILQSDRVASAKSSDWTVLLEHVTIYSMPMLLLGGWEFAYVNFLLHAVTDFVSSRITSKLWKAGKRHWFFVVIGADQAIHLTCLILTIPLIKLWWMP